METINNALKKNWDKLLQEQPKLRIKNAAELLGVSELQLLLLSGDDYQVTPLKFELSAILSRLAELGKVMALTRNESCVHERKGVYDQYSQPNDHVALFVNPDIDLRLFPGVWKYIVAVEFQSRGTIRKSLQFFSKWGEAVHKIYLTPDSNEQAYEDLVNNFVIPEEEFQYVSIPKPARKSRQNISTSGVHSFQESWRNLKDTHDFFPLFSKHKLTRLQALELAPKAENKTFSSYAQVIPYEIFDSILRKVAGTELEIMMFVGNDGMIQIHTGQINKIVDFKNWFNVMDPDFNLHLNTENIASVWAVFKPTQDGLVSSFEVFDHQENLILQVFGKRKPGIPEIKEWQEMVIESTKR